MVKGKDDIRMEPVCMYMRLCKSCHDLEELSLFAQLRIGLLLQTATSHATV
jgi:hypothetical protein